MERENVKVRGGEPEPDLSGDPRAAKLVVLARLMDSEFELPGTGVRIGLDPLLGLVPGIGDVLTTLVSLYIVHQARTLGASRRQIRSMLLNVGIDFLVGEIPILGDLFDFAFKANQRNLLILGFTPAEIGAPAGQVRP